jgi:hypothetical protein
LKSSKTPLGSEPVTAAHIVSKRANPLPAGADRLQSLSTRNSVVVSVPAPASAISTFDIGRSSP